MNPSVICFPQPGKAKSNDVMAAFAEGAGGLVSTGPRDARYGLPAAFFGVVGIEDVFARAMASGRDWFYGDNSYFDRCRGKFFRFGQNEFQLSRLARPDHARAKALGLAPAKWQSGKHVIVVEQSPHFLRLSGVGDDWAARTVAELKRYTDRPIRLRPWRRDKDKAAAGLRADLAGAWALVTHMSAAAVEALLSGVPVFVTGPCAASPMASGELSAIKTPHYPDGRENWAAGLAGHQWTIEELRDGTAWRVLHGDDSA